MARLETMLPYWEGRVMERAPLLGTKWLVLMLKVYLTPIYPPLRELTETTPKLNLVHFSTVLGRLLLMFLAMMHWYWSNIWK